MGGAGRAGSVLVKLLSTAGTGYFYVKVTGRRIVPATL
jgi:ribosomal protein L33